VDRSLEDKHPILLLGMIDDLDETFVDGQRIGKTGSFSDHGKPRGRGDEYTSLRAYTLPSEVVKRGGVHTLAVRVFDLQLHGGIYAPPMGLVAREKFLDWQRGQEKEWNWFHRLFESIRK
jgi:sialate O-acetylesterase